MLDVRSEKHHPMAYLLSTLFGVSVLLIWLHWRQVRNLAVWLHLNKHSAWVRYGSPGTTFFKGDEGNRMTQRTSSLQLFYRAIRQPDFASEHSEATPQKYLRQFYTYGRLALWSLASFVACVFVAALLDG